MGTFKERIQWVGDPRWKDGSIVIHNLDYSDNGTFTCDVKNPPDIVGKTSKVTLYVFEKGARGHGTGGQGAGVWEVGQGGVRKGGAAGGGGQMPALLPLGFWEGGRKAASGGRRCGARPLLGPHSCPSPHSAHSLRGGAGRRHRGRSGRGAAAAAALLPGPVLLAPQAGGPAEEAQVRGGRARCRAGRRQARGGCGRPAGGSGGATPTAPLSLQRHGEGEIPQAWEGLVQARPAG